MSAFAGFVQGVFQGMDWREGRDARKEQREWAREDRDWTKKTRGRQTQVWGQQDEDRARAEEERARQQEYEDQERALLGQITSPQDAPRPPSQQGISIAEAAPDDGTGRVEAPAGQGVGISMNDLGASQSPDQAAASSMMQDRLSQRVEAARNAKPAAPPAEGRRADSGAPDPELVAEGARMSGIEPYTPGKPRGQADQPQQPSAGRGISLFASPAFASTMPEGGPQAPERGPGQATQDAVQGRGQGYSDYQEATRGIRSDAPRRGSMDEMVERERAANAPRQEASPEAQARAAEVRRKALSIIPAGDPVTAVVDRLSRSGMGIASTAANLTGGALSAVGATDAGARMYDTGEGMKDAQRRLNDRDRAEAEARRAPAPGTASAAPAAPAPGNQSLPGSQGPTRAAAAGLQIGGAQDVPQPASVSSAGGEAIQDAITSATRKEGVSIAAAARGQTTSAENRRIAETAGKGISQGWNMEAAAELEQFYIQNGNFEKAKMVQDWAKDKKVQAGIEKWGEAMVYMQLNDKEGLLRAITELYNMKGYYDDGLSVVAGRTEWIENDDDEIVALIVTFKDNATGRQFTQRIDGAMGMIGTAVIGAMAPDSVFERMSGEVEAQRGAAADSRQDELSHSDWRGYLSQAREMLGVGSNGMFSEGATPVTQEQIVAKARELAAARSGSTQGDVPVYAD